MFPVLLVCSAGVIQAAGITHVLGAKKSVLDPASDTVNAGLYSNLGTLHDNSFILTPLRKNKVTHADYNAAAGERKQ